MKNKFMILGALMLTLSVTSCHKDSDVMLSYVYNDDMAFYAANRSYAEKFKVFWKSMNSTYSLWDYEKDCGLDWDEHYRVMLPKFEGLDTLENVSDDMLKTVMEEMVAPLHDGHMVVYFFNHSTSKYVRASPNLIRNSVRPDFNLEDFSPNLQPYSDELQEWKEGDTYVLTQLRHIMQTKGIGLQWAKARYDELLAKQDPTENDATTLVLLKKFINEIQGLGNQTNPLESYNRLVEKYAVLNIPFLDPINENFENTGIKLKYGLFKDNIAYLHLSEFSLSSYLDNASFQQYYGDSKHATEIAKAISDAYWAWFNAIQRLHKQQKLKGVIIDLRSNLGGSTNDAIYVLGSLAPKGGIQYGYARFKRGSGRYDYSPLMPMMSPTMDADHEVVDDVPITILVNCWSVSMSEVTVLSAKQLPNTRIIGKRTWGGICSLTSQEDFSSNYTGHIGKKNVTPVYVNLPMVGLFDMNKHIVEGNGIQPDIEVDLDVAQFKQGRDTQLERALQYIRTGN